MEIHRRLAVTTQQARGHLEPFLGPAAKLVAVIPAAGRGERSGLQHPKQYHRLHGQTVLARSIRALARFSELAAIVVVLDPEDQHWQACGLDQELADLKNIVAVPIGGKTRRDSVIAGCDLVQQASGRRDDLWVMVHDAARPGVSLESLTRLWQACAMTPQEDSGPSGAILALPVADTVKRSLVSDGQAMVLETLDRSQLWSAQTPQLFPLNKLLDAYRACPSATDEASAIEFVGGRVRLVPGEAGNMKLTTADDFDLMEAFLKDSPQPQSFIEKRSNSPLIAIGQGVDVHALVAGRPLIIGGVEIPFERGLEGHSDADVLLHAITDAILGAAGMGDIGRLFPDTDPRYKGADSRVLLREAVAVVHAAGWSVSQIDATVIAQRPKISPYAQQMAEVIAGCVSAPSSRINIKGKTTEHLGFTGREEGIAAQAVALLVRSQG